MEPRAIDLNLLPKLDALLRERNVTRAARRVKITQSAMSHALGRLRAQLGDPLLVRTGRGMALTPKAEAMAPRVARVAREVAMLWSATNVHEAAPVASLFAISAGEALQMVFVPGIAAILQAEAPLADLVVTPAGGDAIELLRRGASDLALGHFGALPPDIHQQTLMTDDLVCLVRQGHPLVTSGLTLVAYTGLAHVQVGVQEPIGDLVEARLAKLRLTRRIRAAVTGYAAALALVAQSDAILTLPGLLARRLAPGHGLAILPLPLRLAPWPLSMAWHARASDPEACAWLRQVVCRAAMHLTASGTQAAAAAPMAYTDESDETPSRDGRRARR